MAKLDIIKLGNTQFNREEALKLSYKQFEQSYGKILKGISIEDAYKQLGGKLKSKPDSD